MNYQTLVENFSWEDVQKKFDRQSGDDINMAHLICDRWADDPDRIAIYWEDASDNKQTWTYEKLRQKSNQMAHVLNDLGIKKGDRIAGLLGKDMELIITALAAWKIGAIYVPLFTAFGPDALLHRLNDSGTTLLVTNEEQKKKLEGKEVSVQFFLIDDLDTEGKSFWEFIEGFPVDYKLEVMEERDPSVIQYTSGTTGMPKGAVFAHNSVVMLSPYMKYALNIEDTDIFFGGADMGWSYGLMACTFAPLSFGIPILVYKGSFDVEKIYQLLDEYNVTNFTYAPTAYRMMMAAGPELIKNYNIQTKKFSSAGEPLNAEVVRFFENNFGTAIYDHYGSTESGMIVNNYNITDMVVKPGSMGLPLPGYRVRLIDNQGNVVKNGETGEIAIDTTDQDLNFMGYWNNPKKNRRQVFRQMVLNRRSCKTG